jgi:hypothetical protein
MSRLGKPVEIDELKDAILRMMVLEFPGRSLDYLTVEAALKLVNFEVKQMAMFAAGKEP